MTLGRYHDKLIRIGLGNINIFAFNRTEKLQESRLSYQNFAVDFCFKCTQHVSYLEQNKQLNRKRLDRLFEYLFLSRKMDCVKKLFFVISCCSIYAIVIYFD